MGRNLKAAVPMVKKTRPRSEDEDRSYVYEGIGLRQKNSQENNGRSPGPLGPDDAGPGGPRSTPLYRQPDVYEEF